MQTKLLKKIITLTFVIVIVAIGVGIVEIGNALALPAFPGAEGFGTSTIGGRNGVVIKVTNLNDSGAGSLRAALEASGPRIIIFSVSGTIHLTSIMTVTNPYITIAGQTSPGGIDISGGRIRISTHDVIITHVHFRLGSDVCDQGSSANNDDCDQAGDALQIMSESAYPAYNIVLDHCSFSWGCDETLDISSWYGDTYDITVSNSLIGQGLDINPTIEQHALGILISGAYSLTRPITISFHHNYEAHFQYRFPNMLYAEADLYNNVFYNYDSFTTYMDQSARGQHLNTRHNYYKEGPSIQYSNNCINAPNKHLGVIWGAGTNYALTGTPYPIVHSIGNIACAIEDTTGKYANGYWGDGWPFLTAEWISTTPFSSATAGMPNITTMSSSYASEVVANAGANRIQSTSDLTWDSLDTQLIADYFAGTGSWLTAPAGDRHYPTNWPIYDTPTPPADNDNDGMADTWETSTLGNLTQTANGDYDSDGYTNVEEYLHYLGGYSTPDTTPPSISTYTLTNFISAITNWLQIGNETSDVNSDGVVNTRDLGIVMSNWGD